jgi:hypothetical protein
VGFSQAKSARKFVIKVRLKKYNQGLIDPEQLFKRDCDRDELFSNKVRFIFFNQGLLEKIKSKSG